MVYSLSEQSPINICFDEQIMRQTPWERSKGLTYFQLRQATEAVENYVFDGKVHDIAEAEPSKLLKVVIKHLNNLVLNIQFYPIVL